jgi:hypothetical protein
MRVSLVFLAVLGCSSAPDQALFEAPEPDLSAVAQMGTGGRQVAPGTGGAPATTGGVPAAGASNGGIPAWVGSTGGIVATGGAPEPMDAGGAPGTGGVSETGGASTGGMGTGGLPTCGAGSKACPAGNGRPIECVAYEWWNGCGSWDCTKCPDLPLTSNGSPQCADPDNTGTIHCDIYCRDGTRRVSSTQCVY